MLPHSVGFGCVRSRIAFARRRMPWPRDILGVGWMCCPCRATRYGRRGIEVAGRLFS